MRQLGFELPCPHGGFYFNKDHRPTLSDHQSLSRCGIKNLLNDVRFPRRSLKTLIAAQRRLRQAIRGMTCPPPTEGKVAERWERLRRNFMSLSKLGGAPEAVDKIHEIITN